MIYVILFLYALLQVSAIVLITKIQINKGLAIFLSLACLTIMLIWAIVMDNNASLYEYFPFKYGVILYNISPLLLAMTLGFTLSFNRVDLKRILLYAVLLIGLNMFYFSSLIYRSVRCTADYEGIVTMQTTDYTCGPASASTLFRLHDIVVSEEEMAELCMTNTRGTSIGQLYYGMRVIGDANNIMVDVMNIQYNDIGTIKTPAIISVKLTTEVDKKDNRYREKWGWELEVPHAVVFLGRSGDVVEIADPKIGQEKWPLEALRDLWTGKVITIKKCD